MEIIRQSNYQDKSLYSTEIMDKRIQIHHEINGRREGGNYAPKAQVISMEIFKKDEAEKAKVKDMKRLNKTLIKNHGGNPKKDINPPWSVLKPLMVD